MKAAIATRYGPPEVVRIVDAPGRPSWIISPKNADHHIQCVYSKTRAHPGPLQRWTMQNDLIRFGSRLGGSPVSAALRCQGPSVLRTPRGWSVERTVGWLVGWGGVFSTR